MTSSKLKLLTIVLLFSFSFFYSFDTCLGGDNSNKIELNYLFKPGCLKCIKAEKQLTELKEKYPSLAFNKYNVTDTDNLEIIIALLDKYSVPEDYGFLTPTVFIGKHYYIKENIDINAIEKVIKVHSYKLSSPAKTEKLEPILSDQNVVDTRNNFLPKLLNKLNSFSYLTVFLAGLIDGINPCAFALLIFFLSYLKIAGRTKKQLIQVGLTYSISMFVTYFLIGLGFFHGLKVLIGKCAFAATSLYVFSGLLALLCAILSFWDIYLLGRGKNNKMLLRLNEKTQKLTHKLIRDNSRGVYVIGGAIVIAVAVSFLELGCTGQVYLPVISFILQQKIAFYKALTLLLTYNAAFILPLLLIFVLVVLGMTHVKLSRWFQNNLIKIKIITGILFLILGLVIFVQIFA